MATYYVANAPTGDDGNNGTSELTPWETVSKVDATVGSGDVVNYNRGDVWRERHATPKTNVDYQDYGTGNKPSMNGAITKNDVGDWTQAAPNWYVSVAYDPFMLIVDGEIKGQRRAAIGAIANDWDWFWDSGTSRLYTQTPNNLNPASEATSLEIPQDLAPLATWFNSGSSFTNIDFRHWHDAILVWGDDTTLDFTSCDFTYFGQYMVIFNNESGFSTIQSCTFTDWGLSGGGDTPGYAYAVVSQDNTSGNRDAGWLDVLDNTFTMNYTDPDDVERFVIENDAGGWLRNVKRNTFYSNSGMMSAGVGIWRPGISAATASVTDNLFVGNFREFVLWGQELETHGSGISLEFLRNALVGGVACTDDNAGQGAIRVRTHTAASTVTVAYNIIPGTQNGTQDHAGIELSDVDGTRVWNNVFRACDNGFETRGAAAEANMDVRNNIIVDNRDYGMLATNAADFAQRDYNCVYNNTLGDYNGVDMAAAAHDINADPLMVDPANGDFTLQVGSPCLHAGVDVGLTTDYAGNAVSANPEIGAYEYNEPVAMLLRTEGLYVGTTQGAR